MQKCRNRSYIYKLITVRITLHFLHNVVVSDSVRVNQRKAPLITVLVSVWDYQDTKKHKNLETALESGCCCVLCFLVLL